MLAWVRAGAKSRPLQSRLMIFMNRPQGSASRRLATIAAVADLPLFPDRPPLRAWRFGVGDGHVLHVETWGREGARPALVLHGGPGSGLTPLLRRFFDPGRWFVVGFDQRGAGRSMPAGGTAHNTTPHLLADLRALRRALGLERWLVVGGSWGATLALAHALDEPAAVDGLLLRASFLARREDIEAFFASAPAALRDGWARLGDLDDAQAVPLAVAWWRHERALAGATPVDTSTDEPPATAALLQRYRVQSHYLRHGCWLGDRPLLKRLHDLPRVPTLLLHGTHDRVCTPDGARAIAARVPHARLRWVEGAGHDPTHPAMAGAMVEALAAFAARGDFAAPVTVDER